MNFKSGIFILYFLAILDKIFKLCPFSFIYVLQQFNLGRLSNLSSSLIALKLTTNYYFNQINKIQKVEYCRISEFNCNISNVNTNELILLAKNRIKESDQIPFLNMFL